MYKVGGYVVINNSKTIKIIQEIEKINDVFIFYFTDGTSDSMKNCMTIDEVYESVQ
jgi:hypothetical protein